MMTKIQYLLVCLAEESAEVAQRATKALRFGLDEAQPGQSLSNAEHILEELEDLQIIVDMLREEGALSERQPALSEIYSSLLKRKRAKVLKYMDYAVQCGTVEKPPPGPGECIGCLGLVHYESCPKWERCL